MRLLPQIIAQGRGWPPWLQRVGHFQKAAGLMSCEVIRWLPHWAMLVTLPPQSTLEGRASDQRGYSWLVSLWICLAKFSICLGSTPYFLIFLWNGNVYPMPIPLLYFETHSLSGFNRFVRGVGLRLNHISSLTWVQWYLNKTSNFRLYRADAGMS